jgi:hypothetical protein
MAAKSISLYVSPTTSRKGVFAALRRNLEALGQAQSLA